MVPTCSTLEEGESSGAVGVGEDAGVGEKLPNTGYGDGSATTGGRGTAGAACAGEQQPDIGKNKRRGSGGGETGKPQGGFDSGSGPDAELGRLSDVD